MAVKLTLVAAVALGCAAGYVGGRLAGPGGGVDADEVAELEARLFALERNRDAATPTLRGSPGLPGSRAGSSTPSDADAAATPSAVREAGLAAALRGASPELDALVAAAVDRAREKEREGEEAAAKTEEGLVEYRQWIDAQIDEWAEAYELGPQQVEQLKAVAQRALTQVSAAKAQGATPREITKIEVGAQAEIRRIVGEEVYVQTEKERVTRDVRGTITWLAASVGLSEPQHRQVDRILEDGIDAALPEVVRMRSEPMSDADYEAIEKSLEQQRESGWERILAEVLTEEQRRRIPGR